MSRLKDAWNDGGEASRGIAESAGNHVAGGLAGIVKLFGMIVDGFLIFLRTTVLGTISKVPKLGPNVADSLIVAGHKMKVKKGDVICNVIYGDGVVTPRVAKWQSQKTAFETDNGETFYAKGIGYNPKRLSGKVPVVWALRNGSEITEPLEAAIANARKLGRFQQFVREGGDPDVAVDVDPNGYDYGPGVGRPREQAMTDGGVAAGARAGVGAGAMHGGSDDVHYDGTVLSFRDAYEQFGSKVDQEEMQQQETRGKLAALMGDDTGLAKWIIFAIGALLGLFGPSLAAQLQGAADGVAGGGMPGISLWLAPGMNYMANAVAGVPF